MKTRIQILNQIKYYIFTDEDWENVKKICNNIHGRGFYRSFRGKIECSYDDFLDWMNNGYGLGDIVKCGNTIGIIRLHLKEEIRLSSFVNNIGELVMEIPDSLTLKTKDISAASPDDIEKFQQILTKKGLEIDPETGKLAKKRRPIPGQMYYFVYEGRKYAGILKSIHGSEASFYFAIASGKLIDNVIDLPLSDVKEAVPIDTEKQYNDILLRKYGAVWSNLNKCFQYYGVRCRLGEKYYYITDKFTITSCSESRSLINKMRYEMGNYFRKLEDAERFLKKMQELRAEMAKRDDHH